MLLTLPCPPSPSRLLAAAGDAALVPSSLASAGPQADVAPSPALLAALLVAALLGLVVALVLVASFARRVLRVQAFAVERAEALVAGHDWARPGEWIRIGDAVGVVRGTDAGQVIVDTEAGTALHVPLTRVATETLERFGQNGPPLVATVALAYGVPRKRAIACLHEAAAEVELVEARVHVLRLEDAAVVYEVRGASPEPDACELAARRSALLGAVLDALHGAGIEIVSPLVVTTRAQAATDRFVPLERPTPASPAGVGEEALRPRRALETVDELRDEIESLASEREELAKRKSESNDVDVARALTDELERLRLREARLREALASKQD